MIKFPQGFLMGAATSAYQVEGNNVHSDWWQWEKEKNKEASGKACLHYEFYEQDFDLAKSLNHNAHRLSIEWGRIEPEEGKFSEAELSHYLNVVLALKARNIEPVVTLHHFTNPLWFSKLGGWENKRATDYFLRYSCYVVSALKKYVRYWITINEPTIYVSHAYIFGAWPPQIKSYLKAKRVEDNLVSAHIKVYQMIHKSYAESVIPRPLVSLSQHMQAFVPCTESLKNRLAAGLRNKCYNFWLLDRLTRSKALDFIGLNYYSRQLVDLKRWGIRNLLMDVCKANHHPVEKNSLGWDIYPQGLRELILRLNTYGLPVMITENGVCTLDDNLRWRFIRSHLENIYLAMEKGANVIGYLYWSLMDNFEWDKGFGPRFGLIEVDYSTYKRTVRESARLLAGTYKTGILE